MNYSFYLDSFFFFNDTATTEIYTLSLHDALPIFSHDLHIVMAASDRVVCLNGHICCAGAPQEVANAPEYRHLFGRSEEHTSELQSRQYLVCRLLLEKKKKNQIKTCCH